MTSDATEVIQSHMIGVSGAASTRAHRDEVVHSSATGSRVEWSTEHLPRVQGSRGHHRPIAAWPVALRQIRGGPGMLLCQTAEQNIKFRHQEQLEEMCGVPARTGSVPRLWPCLTENAAPGAFSGTELSSQRNEVSDPSPKTISESISGEKPMSCFIHAYTVLWLKKIPCSPPRSFRACGRAVGRR